MAVMRLDKMLSDCGIGSRREIKEYIKRGSVKVDEKTINKSDVKINTDKNSVFVDGKKIIYKKFTYIVMNKPAGVISATEDKKEQTVVDILPDKYKKIGLFPVGRLDKDTVGLLILTNDGKFAHNTLSPKKHIWKKYFATILGFIDQNDVDAFFKGIDLGNGEICKSAKLEICNTENGKTNVFIEISEGKFHQIKRMFSSVGKEVLFLKRVKFGGFKLDENIKEGEVRELTEEEFESIFESTLK